MNKNNTTSKKSKKTKGQKFWQCFWLGFLVVSLAYAWYSFYVPTNHVKWVARFPKAQEVAKTSKKPMMLFFTGAWCVPCKIVKREVFANPEVEKIINSEVVPVSIDIDDPKTVDIVQHYQVGVTPVLIFTNAKGDVLDYTVGKFDKNKFLDMLNHLNK